MDQEPGNVMRRLCLDRSFSSMWSDYKHWLRLLIGLFRQSLAADPESSAGNRVLQELSSCPEFAGRDPSTGHMAPLGLAAVL